MPVLADEYGARAVRDLDARRSARFLVAMTESRWEIAAFVRNLVEFRALNVVDGSLRFSAWLDAVFNARGTSVYCLRRAAPLPPRRLPLEGCRSAEAES